jgi:hypothetical protein
VAKRRAQGLDTSHGGAAGEKGGAAMARRRREVRNWNAEHPGKIVDPELFAREILPSLQGVPLSALVRATELTYGYLSQIRSGKRFPHMRHWTAFRGSMCENT